MSAHCSLRPRLEGEVHMSSGGVQFVEYFLRRSTFPVYVSMYTPRVSFNPIRESGSLLPREKRKQNNEKLLESAQQNNNEKHLESA